MKGKTEVVIGEITTSEFDIDEITQIGCFRFMEKIVIDIYEFVLFELFDHEPMKRFMRRRDV